MENKFEIILMDTNNNHILTYGTNYIPVVGDYLGVSEDKVFMVKYRLLPTKTNTHRTVLMGNIIEPDKIGHNGK